MRILIFLLACSLAGCALHHSGQLRAPARGAISSIPSTQAEPGQGVFSPQLTGKVIELWGVAGCPGTAVPIANIYEIAVAHGISYIDPAHAATILATKTVMGRVIEYAGYAALAVGIAQNWNLFKMNSTWQKVISGGGGVFGLLIPSLEKNAPTVYPAAGADLTVGPSGCGSTAFYSQPTTVAAFVETLK
jgi:hypothetical protein